MQSYHTSLNFNDQFLSKIVLTICMFVLVSNLEQYSQNIQQQEHENNYKDCLPADDFDDCGMLQLAQACICPKR